MKDQPRTKQELLEEISVLRQRIQELEAREKALQSENRHLRDLYDQAPLNYQSLDEEGCFIEVNQVWLDTLGYSAQDVIGKNFSEFLHPDWKEHFRENFPRFKAIGEVLGVEFEMVKKDGSTMLVSFNGKIGRDHDGRFKKTHCIFRDITLYNRVKERSETERKLLHICHISTSTRELMRALADFFKDLTGCGAVGLRMRQGEDFPYYETRGFPKDFVMAENSLCTPDLKGDLLRDSTGNPVLECMCGNVICERFDPAKPFFTRNGSFWTNSTSELLASTSEADRQARTRNRCNGEGYESVALVPLRSDGKTYGLLQLNDPRRGRFTLERIEMLEHFADHVALAIAKHMADEELRNSEDKFRTLSALAPVGIYLTSLDGNCQYVNKFWCEMAGMSPDEALGTGWVQGLHPEDLDTVYSAWQKMVESEGRWELEYRFQTREGKVTWVYGLATPQYDAAGRIAGYIGVNMDITERKKIEETLRGSKTMYQALVNGLPDIVMRFDREGRHLFVSDNVSKVVDLQAPQFIGKTHRELGFPEDQCKFWEDAIRGVFDSVTPFETEYAFDSKNGPAIHNWRIIPELDTIGKVRSVLSISRDITTHRQVERNYRTLFHEMLDGFALHEIICDGEGKPADYRFLVVNPAFERITNLKADDIRGRTVLEVMPGTERHWIETYGRVALTGEPVLFENYSGEMNKHFEVTAFRPAPNQFACIFADITGRKLAEETLLKKTEDLSRFNKMMVGREIKMIDLKKEINALLKKSGEKEKYKIN